MRPGFCWSTSFHPREPRRLWSAPSFSPNSFGQMTCLGKAWLLDAQGPTGRERCVYHSNRKLQGMQTHSANPKSKSVSRSLSLSLSLRLFFCLAPRLFLLCLLLPAYTCNLLFGVPTSTLAFRFSCLFVIRLRLRLQFVPARFSLLCFTCHACVRGEPSLYL